MNSYNPRRRDSLGLAIAESLIGIFLVALLLIALFNLFPTTIAANRQGSQKLKAVNLAQSTLSEWRVKPFEQLLVGESENLPEKNVDNVRFHQRISVKAPDFGDSDNLKVLEVMVMWKVGNHNRSIVETLWVHRLIEE